MTQTKRWSTRVTMRRSGEGFLGHVTQLSGTGNLEKGKGLTASAERSTEGGPSEARCHGMTGDGAAAAAARCRCTRRVVTV